MPGVRGQSPRPTSGGAPDPRAIISRHLATEFVQQALTRTRAIPVTVGIEGDQTMQDDTQTRTEMTDNVEDAAGDGQSAPPSDGEDCDALDRLKLGVEQVNVSIEAAPDPKQMVEHGTSCC